MPWIKRVIIGLVVVAILVGGLYVIGEGIVVTSDVRSLAEKSFSEILKADVDVGTVHLAFLNQITLGGLKIEHEKEGGNFFLADINKIVFRYSLLDLFRRKFDDPSDVRLESPHFEVTSLFFPYDLFQDFLEFVRQGVMPGHLSIRGGALRFESSQWNVKVVIDDISGQMKSLGEDMVELDIVAKPAGRKGGKIRLVGQAAPLRNSYDINCTIDHVNLKGMTVRDICGQIWIKDQRLIIQDLSFVVNNMRVMVQGVIRDISTNPELDLSFEIQERDIRALVNLKGPYLDASLVGSLNFLGFAYEFDGVFHPTATGFAFDNMLVNNEYEAQADVDFVKNTFAAHVEKGIQRFDIKLNIQDFDIDVDLKVEHLEFLGNDIVTAARLHLEPHESFWQSNRLQFRGELESDFFVFNYEPLEDFSGSFMLSFKEARDIEFKWGKSYRFIGRASFQKPFLLDTKLLIKHLDLIDVKRIGDAVIPQEFVSGRLDGEIKLRGSLSNPDIDAYVVIRDGFIGDIDFDQFIISCYGNRYYLRLKDSKVRRKGTEFLVGGDIDFKKENIFEGIEITTKDSVIVLDGWDFVRKEGEGDFHLEKMFGDKIKLDFESSMADPEGTFSSGLPDSKAGVEYKIGEGKSIRISAEEEKEKEYLTIGPKFKF